MNGNQFPEDLLNRIKQCGVMAVVTIDDSSHVVPLAKALLACGIDVMEITLRTDAGFDALRRLRDEVPEMLLGVGTVLRPDQIEDAVHAGAAFGVAPGLNDSVVKHAQQLGLPFAPGVLTPSEVEMAIELGCRQFKFFPAEPVGGIGYLRTMLGPYEHLGLQCFVSGGVCAAHLSGYLYYESVTAIGAVWIASRKLIQTQDWSAVIDYATEARSIVKDVRQR